MNTLSPEILIELAEFIETLEENVPVRAVHLIDAGERAFSAGAHVYAMSGNMDPGEMADLS